VLSITTIALCECSKAEAAHNVINGFSQVLDRPENLITAIFFRLFVFCNCSVAVVKRTVTGQLRWECDKQALGRLPKGPHTSW
jgi:hypothetical protein